jgi:hypothetical protein
MESAKQVGRAMVLAVVAAIGLTAAAGAEEAKGKKVAYAVHTGYFEKNNSGLKGDSSYLAVGTQAQFDKIFGVAFVVGAKQNFLPKGAFESKQVAAVIKRGKALWKYTVENVSAEEGTLYVSYKAMSEDGGGARFASPLIVSVQRGPYTQVVFIENGKQAGKAELPK